MDEDQETRRPGEIAHACGRTLESRRVGALPVLGRFLKRLRIDEFLGKHLPREDRRSRVPTATALLLLVRNLLVSREPLYGVGEWAARHDTQWLDISDERLPALNDDRVGRALDRLFDADVAALALDVAAHAVSEFDVTLDELHNDSTTVTFHGDYEGAERERTLRGRLRLAVTYGHNKDHRPDLKQLLYILTVSGDGAVPVHFRVESGNATDDRSHTETWDLLRKLTGRADFLYVADCKLATAENMAYIHRQGGRFLSVLPRTRSEDAAFRARVVRGDVDWRPIHDKYDDGDLIDQFSICEPTGQSAEGYRLIWYHSRRKAELDTRARLTRLERAVQRLEALRQKLGSPRTRYRTRTKVVQAAEAILDEFDVRAWITVDVTEHVREKFRQEKRGRPGKGTKYVRQEAGVRFQLAHRVDLERLTHEARCDGIFPLISNERSLSELHLLLAYKQQPAIERRFEQMKTDFVVAPVYLKETSRIQALLCVYFIVLLVEALLERELRRAMERAGIESLPLYPERRGCRRPTARKVIDLFEDVQRHTLTASREPAVVFTTELTRVQRKVLRLLGMSGAYEY